MSDDRLKPDAIGYLYGDLDRSASRRFEKAVKQDSDLAAELSSLRATRELYAQDALPDPSPALSEAILRQEVMLRAPRETLGSQIWMLLMHPAVGLTALLVVVGSAGLLYRLSTPPSKAVGSVAAVEATPAMTDDAAPPTRPGAAEKRTEKPAERAVERLADKATATGENESAALPPEQTQAQGTRDVDSMATASSLTDDKKRARTRAKKKPRPAPSPVSSELAEQEMQAPSGWSATRGRALNQALAQQHNPKSAAKDSAAPARPRSVKKERSSSTRGSLGFGATAQTAAPAPEAPSVRAAPTPRKNDSRVAGSAGQLTDPSQLQRPDTQAELKGSAGKVRSLGSADEVGGLSASSAGGRRILEDSEIDETRVAANKPARRVQKRVASGSAKAQELLKLDRARGRQRVQQELDSAMVAFDRRHYEDAIDLFRRVQAADPSHKHFGPLPQIMEARSLMRLRRYRQAAALYEAVLRGFSKIPNRQQVSRELLACYQASGQTELARRTKRSMQQSDEAADADSPAKSQRATPTAEPADAPARR